MPDINTRVREAKEKVVNLQYQLSQVQKANADQSLHGTAASGNYGLQETRPGKCRRTLKGHFGKINAMHWGGDSRELVSASQDGLLLVWNAQTTNKLQSITLKSCYVMSCGIEQSRGNLVASGGLDNMCTIYRRDNPQATPWELASHEGFLSCCRFISESQIVTASGDSTCLLWDIQSMKPIQSMAEHTKDCVWVSLQPNSAAGGGEGGGTGVPAETNIFASCSIDQTVKIWDLRTPTKSVMTFDGFFSADVNGVEWMPSDTNCLAACSQNNKIQVLDMRACNSLASFSYAEPGSPGNDGGDGVEIDGADMDDVSNGFTSIAWSRSGRLVFCGHTNGSVIGFDVLKSTEDSLPVYNIQAHEEHISGLGMAPNGDALCSGSWDCTLKVWA